ncbi:MAG: hypothetical protein JO316_02180 [Abitibacteriaceae bacterium]|nr:hypothetical protein [Abditibacteriaceae bacterium]
MTAQRLDLIMATLMGAVLGVLLLFAHYYWVMAAWVAVVRSSNGSHSYPLGPTSRLPMQYFFAGQWLRITLSGVALGGLTAYTWSHQRSDQTCAADWCLRGGLLLFMVFLVRQATLILHAISIFTSRSYMGRMPAMPVFRMASIMLNIFDAALIWSLLLIWWGWTLRKQNAQKTP